MNSIIQTYKSELIKTIENIDNNEILQLKNEILKARDNSNFIYVFGNGGSGSTASHMVCDLLKGCSYNKEKKIKIISLNDNMPTITAYSNDVNYSEVFLEQLKNYLKPNDLVIGISGSGNSSNVLKAIEYANENNAVTFGMTGYDGGKLKNLATYSLNAKINNMQISEDIHLIVLHILYMLISK
jgi:D-sedoheptulose 7-phosphate isomerase